MNKSITQKEFQMNVALAAINRAVASYKVHIENYEQDELYEILVEAQKKIRNLKY